MTVFDPVKTPSTVFNNMLADIMKKIAAQHDFDFTVTRDFYKDVYSIVEIHQGVSVGRNPFQSSDSSTEIILTVDALKKDRSIRYSDPIFGVNIKQFFMNEQEVTDYFKKLETALSDRMDTVLKIREERKDK